MDHRGKAHRKQPHRFAELMLPSAALVAFGSFPGLKMNRFYAIGALPGQRQSQGTGMRDRSFVEVSFFSSCFSEHVQQTQDPQMHTRGHLHFPRDQSTCTYRSTPSLSSPFCIMMLPHTISAGSRHFLITSPSSRDGNLGVGSCRTTLPTTTVERLCQRRLCFGSVGDRSSPTCCVVLPPQKI